MKLTIKITGINPLRGTNSCLQQKSIINSSKMKVKFYPWKIRTFIGTKIQTRKRKKKNFNYNP
jgi:hypothetical protein